MERGTGKTTKQMKEAQQNAVFVWCNGHLAYPLSLARKINREDLEIVSPYWLDNHRWRGRRISGIVVDHAADLTTDQIKTLHHVHASTTG